MEITSQNKGNIGEHAASAELLRNGADVTRIAAQDDPHQWDLIVTLRNPTAVFKAQVKYLGDSGANLTIEVRHLRDWLSTSQPTAPMWWDDKERKLYWADPLRFLIGRGKALHHQTVGSTIPSFRLSE